MDKVYHSIIYCPPLPKKPPNSQWLFKQVKEEKEAPEDAEKPG